MPRKTINTLSLGKSGDLKENFFELNESSMQNEFLEGLFSEPDRSAVIVGASYLEELTRRKLSLILNKGNSKSRESLFNGTGPLATFSARINLLHCLGKINTDAANDLNVLRKLRNYCAHNWEAFSFNEKVEKEHLVKFRNYLNLSKTESLTEYAPRTQFMLVCAFYVIVENFHENES